MSKNLSACFALSLFAVVASGCCCLDRTYHPTGCANDCEPGLAPAHGCSSCGGGCVGQSLMGQTRNELSCCAGCGDVYWGEWLSTPPDDCDPCDGCGNWIGPRCCPPRLWDFLSCGVGGLWGWRCGADTCGDHGSGCSSCDGHDSGPWSGIEFDEGDVIPTTPGEPRKATPVPQNGPTKAKPETVDPPQPMTTQAHALHGRNPRYAAPKSLPMQPTRSKRPSQQHSASGYARPRSL